MDFTIEKSRYMETTDKMIKVSISMV